MMYHVPVFYFLLLIVLIPAPFLFFLYLYRTIEKKALRTIALLPDDVENSHTDVRIWFKGFDMVKRVNRHKINPLKSLYSYNLADLLVFKDGIVVVGKVKAFGRTRLLSPFAICRPRGEIRLSMVPSLVRFIRAEVVGEDIDIQFHDPEYTNHINLVVKKIGNALFNDIVAGGQ